jgi:nicotinamide-nucleotide amidase
MSAELIIIGSELLLGETLDTNAQTIARALRAEGILLERVTTVADDRDRIASEIRAAARRSGVVITTGGLGPTVDDPTRAAAAQAADTPLEFHPELWEILLARFARSGRIPSENNRTQAHLPAGAEALPNPNGTAPGFALPIGDSIVLAMPGVPVEMEAMLREQVLPRLRARLGALPVLRTRILHVVGLNESQVDERVAEFEKMENPAVGLAAYPGRTDIRITVRGEDAAAAQALLAQTEGEIRARVGEHVYGADAETLAAAVLRRLAPGESIVSAEWGTGGALAAALGAEPAGGFRAGLVHPASEEDSTRLEQRLSDLQTAHSASHAVGIRLAPAAGGFGGEFIFRAGGEIFREQRTFLQAAPAARQWAAAIALTRLWTGTRRTSG